MATSALQARRGPQLGRRARVCRAACTCVRVGLGATVCSRGARNLLDADEERQFVRTCRTDRVYDCPIARTGGWANDPFVLIAGDHCGPTPAPAQRALGIGVAGAMAAYQAPADLLFAGVSSLAEQLDSTCAEQAMWDQELDAFVVIAAWWV
jgi:hypothetical protein